MNKETTGSVFKKLQAARVKLAETPIKKSGNNKFVGFQYFELADFLPHIQKIFNEVGLCGITVFSKDVAALQIFDVDHPESHIVFTSPMGSAALKGCHEVQNIGAVETYQRRYLYVNALEIVENDALDGSMSKEVKEEAPPKKTSKIPSEEQIIADKIEGAVKQDLIQKALEIYTNNGKADLETKTKVWGLLSTETKNKFHELKSKSQEE